MVKFAFYEFEFGYLKIGCTDTAVTFLKRADSVDDVNSPSALSDLAFSQIREYLDGKRMAFDFPWELRGTDFQKRAWQALCTIPYGETRTYRDVAALLGNPNASRAVGMANHHNPLWIVVPCHRVVGSNGKLTGYAGGLQMKAALLELEKAHSSASPEAHAAAAGQRA